jgi:Zn-dependent M28 family amino/carboxypeptidase
MKKILFSCLILSGILSCQSGKQKDLAGVIAYANIEKHIAELSSDKYLGRMPMSSTEKPVVDYIASQMKEIGLEPANNGSYFQEVPILKVTSKISTFLRFKTPGGSLDIPKMTDYVSFTRKMEEELSLENSDVIFAGFGITAPEFNRNDFEGIDVKGKTILVFINDPGYGTESSYFKGNTMTYYGRWTYKFEEAARQGAKACFIIHETGPAGYGWNVVSNNGETTKLYLQPEDGYRNRCSFEGWISYSSADQLFVRCGLDISEVKKRAVSPAFKPFSLPVTVSATIKNSFETGVSGNVCGVIKGKTRPDEVIVYTAHWDHLGVGKPVNGDSIYNGATDNASAIAWMLEIARAFKSAPQPERSVLFFSPTGEESGLLGAEFYCEHPFFELNKTAAVINTDVLLFVGEFNDVTLTGSGYSELDQWVETAAKEQGRYLASDPNPENGMFFRSDHFPFVKRGVPAIFAKGYSDAKNLGPEKTKELISSYWKNIYHTPSDEYKPDRDNLSGLVNDALLMYNVGNRLANSADFPAWKEDSGFRR